MPDRKNERRDVKYRYTASKDNQAEADRVRRFKLALRYCSDCKFFKGNEEKENFICELGIYWENIVPVGTIGTEIFCIEKKV